MSCALYRCQECGSEADWRLESSGGGLAWACDAHLHAVARAQIDAGEVPQLHVQPHLADAGPIPWRPAGRLIPAPERGGEWHDFPDDDHQLADCPCDPELHVSTGDDGQLRSVWAHRTKTG